MREGIADRAFAGAATYLTDLSRCRPAHALSRTPRREHWRMLNYAADGLDGVMLLAGPETAAPEIRLPLEVDGWHAVSIGVMPTRSLEEGGSLELQVRLCDEDVPALLTLPPDHASPPSLVEMFWKTADLTGRALVLSQVAARMAPGDGPGSVQCGPARVAYVKLVPLDVSEIAHEREDRVRRDTRRLFAHQDANGPLGLWRLTSTRDIQREIEPYRDTDFSRLYWEVGRGDLMFSHTELGREATFDGLGDFARVFDRLHVESRRVLRERNIDPFDVAVDYAHAIGLELHAAYRVAGFRFPPPYDHFNWGDSVYERHPEWRGVNREGRQTPRLAYTYPEVRAHVIDLLREMCQRPIDGVCLLYCRRPPLVEYEPPLVDGFMRRFGKDPRTLDPLDPQWLHYRAEVLTQFMREVRQALDETAAAQGRSEPFHISAVVLSSEVENLANAIDLRQWVAQGLVDTIIPYTSELDLDSVTPAWTDPASLRFFVDLVRGTPVTLAPNVMPRHMPPGDLRQRAADIFDAGAEHMFFWDSAGGGGRATYGAMWNALRRLGHRAEIDAWRADGARNIDARITPLRTLGDWDLGYQTPG